MRRLSSKESGNWRWQRCYGVVYFRQVCPSYTSSEETPLFKSNTGDLTKEGEGCCDDRLSVVFVAGLSPYPSEIGKEFCGIDYGVCVDFLQDS